VHEQGGIVWTYMGPSELQPEKPQLEWSLVPESHRFVSKRIQESNWFQALEGGYDYMHVGMLHRGSMTENMTATMPKFKFTAPVLQEIIETDYGCSSAAGKNLNPGRHTGRFRNS